MPRCNLTLKQKSRLIELSNELTTEQLAKKFRVHPTTVTRTLRKKTKILDQASRVNTNFKTVQTNQRIEEHDSLILNYIKTRQEADDPISIRDICDKAVEFANALDRSIKSKRGWWRRFKVRCNIIKSQLSKASPERQSLNNATPIKEKIKKQPAAKKTANQSPSKTKQKRHKKNDDSLVIKSKRKSYTLKVKETKSKGKKKTAAQDESNEKVV